MHQIARGLEEGTGIRGGQSRGRRSTQTNLTAQSGVTIHQGASVLTIAIHAIRTGSEQQEL